MTNRDDLNIDSFLNSKQSLSNGTSKNLTQPNFDSQMDWSIINTPHIFNGAVTDAKLGNFTFNKGTGGTLTLGGTNNGNGQLIVRSSSGGTICTIDNNGITVSSGSITIKNSGGTNVLDSKGLNSINNFETMTGVASGVPFSTTTTGTPVPVTGGTVTTSSFDRTKVVFLNALTVVHFSGLGTADFATIGYLYLSDGNALTSISISREAVRGGGGGYNDGVSSSTMQLTGVIQLGTGVHNINVRTNTQQLSSTGTLVIESCSINYTVLGN